MTDFAKLVIESDTRDLAKALELLAKLSSASKTAEKNVKDVGDAAEKANRKAADSYKSLHATVKNFLYTIGAAAGIYKFISATAGAGKAQAQLVAVLRSTNGVSQQSIKTLNDHAKALQNLTTFEDDAINAAQGLLLTFTKIRGDVFKKATVAITDVATALGTDLKSAAIQVGKALNDPIAGMSVLSRSGIQFTDTQKAMVKSMVESGNVMGAQTLILKQLETQFGGSAEAIRNTFDGAMAALQVALGDLFEVAPQYVEPLRVAIEGLIVAVNSPSFQQFAETVGGAIFMALTLTAQALTGVVYLIGFLSDNIGILTPLVQVLGVSFAIMAGPAVLIAVQSLAVAIGVGLANAIRLVTALMLANPLGAMIIGISTVLVAVYHFRDEIKSAIGVDVVGIAKQAANYVIGSFVAAYHDIEFVWKNFPNIIGAAAIGAANLVIRSVNSMVTGAKAAINSLIELVNQIPGIDIGTLDTSAKLVDEIANPYADAIAGALQAREEKIRSALSFDYIGALGKMFETTPLKEIDFGSGGFAVPQIESATDATNALAKALDASKASAGAAGKAITDAANGGADIYRDSLTPAIKEGNEALDGARDVARGFASDLVEGLKSGEGFWKSFKNAGLNALQTIADKMLTSGVNSFASALAGGSSGTGGILGSLFAGFFAGGGDIPSGKFGIAGEGGGMRHAEIVTGPATVTPVRNLGGMTQTPQKVMIDLRLSDDLRAEVGQQINASEKRAVSVAVSQSAASAKKNFGSVGQDYNMRQG